LACVTAFGPDPTWICRQRHNAWEEFMNLRRGQTRVGFVIIAPLIALACDAVATASTAPEVSFTNVVDRWDKSEKIVGGGGLSLSIYEAGPGDARPVVFIHGFTQNHMTWDRQLRGMADRFHLLAYDLRGHGASEKPLDADKYTDSSLWADDLAAVIRARNLHKPVLVGWSYGGYVIADYVRKFGDDELGGLVFVGAVTKNGTDEAAGFLTEEVLGIFGDVLSADVRASLDATRALTRMFAGQKPAQWEIAFGSAMMVPPEVRLGMFSRVLENDDVLSRIRVQTLVVHGATDRIVKVSSAQHTAKTVPGAKLLVYDDAGHAPHLDDPIRFNRDLAQFVRSVR
jgi:non-heme chloroperoxidase